jgi:hypothetical protein
VVHAEHDRGTALGERDRIDRPERHIAVEGILHQRGDSPLQSGMILRPTAVPYVAIELEALVRHPGRRGTPERRLPQAIAQAGEGCNPRLDVGPQSVRIMGSIQDQDLREVAAHRSALPGQDARVLVGEPVDGHGFWHGTPMSSLPSWRRGTPAVLCVAGPHAIPVSTAVRVGDRRIMLALGRGRETLGRLRSDPLAALCLLGEGVAFTAHGQATVVAEELESADTVVAVELAVERVQDHLADGRTEILDGARWRWLDRQSAESEPAIVAELERLRR